MSDKVRENRLRRTCERRGFKLVKSKRRDPHAIDFGGFMITEPFNNTVVAGSEPVPFSLSLDDVEAWLSDKRDLGSVAAGIVRTVRRIDQVVADYAKFKRDHPSSGDTSDLDIFLGTPADSKPPQS